MKRVGPVAAITGRNHDPSLKNGCSMKAGELMFVPS